MFALRNLFVLAAVLSVGMAVLAVNRSTATTLLSPNTSLVGGNNGTMAVDCDAAQPGVQSDCTYDVGEVFSVQIHPVQPPTDGYAAFQVVTSWDGAVLNYLPTVDSRDEGLWSGCNIVPRSPEPPTGDPPQLFACFPFPILTVGSTFTGAIAQFEFTCKAAPDGSSPPHGLDPDQSEIELLPGNPQGSYYHDVQINVIEPTLLRAIVTCSDSTPTPTVTPTPTMTPTVTPTPARPDLTITKGDEPDPVYSGSPLTYTIEVRNVGSAPASSVRLIDTLPWAFVHTSTTTTRGTCVHDGSPIGGVVDCDLGSLNTGPAAFATITIEGFVQTSIGFDLINEATVDPNNDVAEFNESDNSVAVTTTVIPRPPWDVDKDGTVSIIDIGIVVAHFGEEN